MRRKRKDFPKAKRDMTIANNNNEVKHAKFRVPSHPFHPNMD